MEKGDAGKVYRKVAEKTQIVGLVDYQCIKNAKTEI